jgi:hypothetical protein
MVSGRLGVELTPRRPAEVGPPGGLGGAPVLVAGQVLLVMVGVGLIGIDSPGLSMGCGLV